MKSYHKSSCYKWDPSKSIHSLFPFPQFRINQIEFELKERKKSPLSPFLLFVHRERERERPPVWAGNFPTGDFLEVAFLILQINETHTENPFEYCLDKNDESTKKKKTQNFAHNQIENNPDPSVPCRLLLASETGPQITPGTARA